MLRVPSPLSGIDYLIDRRFPTLKARRGVAHALGRPRREREETEAMIEKAERYEEELLLKPRAEIEALVEHEKAAEKRETDERAKRIEERRFFNAHDAAADFDHWSKAAFWTIDEAVALSLGKEPRVVQWHKLESLIETSDFAREYAARWMLAKRAKTARQLDDHNLPGFFLAWAARTRIDIPSDLIGAVRALGHQIADWKTAYDEGQATNSALRAELDELRRELAESRRAEPAERNEKPLITRERETALKLVIGMAIGGYGYEPTATRSSVAREISEDIVRAGLTLDEDTVRSWLKEARDNLLPAKPEDGDD